MIVARPTSNDGPLKGVRVLDLTRFYLGRFSTLILAGLGTEVIHIDEPWRGDPTMTGPAFLGKEGVSLERQESTTMKQPIRFSTAFCMWLLIGGPLL